MLNTILCLLAGAFAHIGVNTLNEFLNFKSGLDKTTKRTPFSGGSGALIVKPELSSYVLSISIISIILTIAIGVYFVILRGVLLALLLSIGLFLVIMYDIVIVKRPILCYFAPGIGFGLVFIIGTEIVLTGNYSGESIICSSISLISISNILLLNQYPDIDADKQVGRKNIPIVWGTKNANIFYIGTCIVLFLSIIGAVVFNTLPIYSLIILIFIIPSIIISDNLIKYTNNIKKLETFLGLNIIMNLGIVMSLAIVFILDRLI